MTKVAIITGGARRIGAEITRTLHAQGFNVIVHYRYAISDANALVAELNQQRPDSACALPLDLSEISQFFDYIDHCQQRWGRIDLLINNASSFYPTSVNFATDIQWDDLFNSNVKGAFFLTQHALPWLQQTQGQVINITDIHAKTPLKGYPIYCMAKAALDMMTQSLARECGPTVRVNAIAPGAILWPEDENTLSEAKRTAIIDATALKRPGTPAHIAKAVLALISNDYMTGTTLTVDGGRSVS